MDDDEFRNSNRHRKLQQNGGLKWLEVGGTVNGGGRIYGVQIACTIEEHFRNFKKFEGV